MRKVLFLLGILVCSVNAFSQETTQGSLYAVGKKGVELGACPLKNTKVQTDISGFLARVKVTQEFENTFTEPIEAVYTFPLSQNGAVDDMTMKIGERTIHGKIMRREEARKVYETAKTEGKTASLLDQERPNIFTQSVANIMPGEKIIIEISYVETLKYEDGSYEFVFPMVVGPRYIPGSVKDASKIKPPVAVTRAGHDISVEVNLNAGVPVEEIRSKSHEIVQTNFTPNTAKVTLKNETTIPNKDFILRYDVTGKRIEDAILTHRDVRGGFFTLILQPPDKIATEDRTPKEIVFVLDTSGSMSGFPIEKAKEAMKMSLDGLYPDDTFNLITFAGDTAVLFEKPVPATQANLDRAQEFLAARQSYGGTEMMKAIKTALDPSDSQSHLRIVCFMTDAYVGNDNEIIAEIQKHPNARVFAFGIGSSVNRFLLDKMAEEGRGEVEYVGLEDDGSKAAKKFYERVRTPLLTDLSIDWNGMPVADVYPSKLSDLFSAKPVVLNGRYTKAASGTIRLKGKVAGQEYVREIAVNLPETEAANDSLASLWARTRIDEVMKKDYTANAVEVQNTVTQLGLEFRLMTQFTSFVAVEERVVNQNGTPVKVEVPVNIPEGVDRKMAVGDDQEVISVGDVSASVAVVTKSGTKYANRKSKSGTGTGQGSGRGTGSGSGVGYGSGAAKGPPPPARPVATSNTTVTSQAVQSLPAGTTFSSGLMTMSPQVQIDGASGSENVFVIDGTEVTNARTGTLNSKDKVISGGVLNGRAISLPKPEYPKAARAVNAKGTVNVQVTIDELGNVVSANAVSGHPLLRPAAEKAALASKFAPTSISGKALKVDGVIVYNFVESDKTNITVDKMRVAPLTETDKKNLILSEKLHFWLFALVERLQKGISEPAPNEAKFVRDGRAEIQIVLAAKTPEVLEKLKALGFEITSDGKDITGRIAVEKLAALAEIEEVQLILPKI